MKKNLFSLIAVCGLALLVVSCSQSSTSTEPPDDELVQEFLQTANTQLQSGDIVSAKAAYTQTLDAIFSAVNVGTSVKNSLEYPLPQYDQQSAEAYFGRAFCNMILLTQQSPSVSILEGLGQSTWDLDTVFGETGYFQTDNTTGFPFDQLGCDFNSESWRRLSHKKWRYMRCILAKSKTGYTATNLTTSLVELIAYMNEITVDLEQAITVASANYTIPKELYNGSADLNVNHADMLQILSGFYFAKAGIQLAYSWTFDLDLSSMYDENGKFIKTKQDFVDELNTYFTLKTDNLVEPEAYDDLYKGFYYSKSALQEVIDGATNGILNKNDTNQTEYSELLDMATAGVNSFNESVALPHIMPEINSYIAQFFSSPPNIESNAFVCEENKMKMVETFWQQMITNACDYNLSTRPRVKVFSSSVRALSKPYKGLFNQIFGNRFGLHLL